jgi:hypothetical protein
MKKKKEENIIHLCFKYYNCKLCPRQEKCEKEMEKDRKNVINTSKNTGKM